VSCPQARHKHLACLSPFLSVWTLSKSFGYRCLSFTDQLSFSIIDNMLEGKKRPSFGILNQFKWNNTNAQAAGTSLLAYYVQLASLQHERFSLLNFLFTPFYILCFFHVSLTSGRQRDKEESYHRVPLF